jgi:hypothetical protein
LTDSASRLQQHPCSAKHHVTYITGQGICIRVKPSGKLRRLNRSPTAIKRARHTSPAQSAKIK